MSETDRSAQAGPAVGSPVDLWLGLVDAEIEAFKDGDYIAIEDGESRIRAFAAAVRVAERERCKRIVQINQCRNGHHRHDGTTLGHYNVSMIAEIDGGLPPKA